MKILLINDKSDLTGGSQIYIFMLKKVLSKIGHKVKIFSSDKNKNSQKLFADYTFKSVKKNPLTLVFNPFSYMKLRKALKEFNPNIIHLNNFLEESTPSILTILEGFPVVATLHDFSFIGPLDENQKLIDIKEAFFYGKFNNSRLKFIFHKFRINLNKKLSKNIILFVAVSNYIKRNFISIYPEKYKKKTIVIPNGVDSNIFKPLKNIKQKKNVILFTGRFIDIKGIREIINVAKKLPQHEFWFAGEGPLAKEINLPNTKNLGFKTTKELVKLYNQATICIVPSHRESFGLVGLEAMSCGKAVIVTPLGFSEYIENGKEGIIIPAKNEKALKNAIVDLMTNEKLRKRLGKNARKKALKYSWDKVAKQYLSVFKQVIKEQNLSFPHPQSLT